jgi:hypothetical protein
MINTYKKITLFLATILLITTSTFAQRNSSRSMLRIREIDGRKITVTVDGRKFNKIGTKLTVGDLPSGNHMLKVYVVRQNNNQGRRYDDNGRGNTTARLIYQGNIRTQVGKIYFLTVDEFNDMDVEVHRFETDEYNNFNTWNNDQWESNGYGWGGNHWNHDHDNDNGNNSNNDWNNDNNNNNDNFNDNGNGWSNYNGAMSSQRFELLKEQVRKASFETAKTSVIKQAMKNNKITCQQLLQLMNEYSFESAKLQLAKDLYRNVVDVKNYFILNDAFTFQSSKDELADFLNNK